jgi:hypothetical protein
VNRALRVAAGGLALGAALIGLGCGRTSGSFDPGGPDSGGDAGSGGGAVPGECQVSLLPSPVAPVAGPGSRVHVSAEILGAMGTLSYAWHVQYAGGSVETSAPTAADIDFSVPAPGIYLVSLATAGASPACATAVLPLTVEAPGAVTETVRLRIVPPRGVDALATEKMFLIKGGGDADLGTMRVDAGAASEAVVLGPGGGVPAYLRFSPVTAPELIVEAFANASGFASQQLAVGVAHTVLVVPSSATALAPRRIAGWVPGGALSLDAGATVTGAVLGPTGAPVAGAAVRLTSDGVPSTVATTAGDGSFALHVAPGASITATVAPPAASGLPRLSATSAAFDLGAAMQIRYAANIALVDLGGASVRRLDAQNHPGPPIAGARVTVVGALPAIGQVTAGAAVIASGDVRIAATADAGGALPATLVPSAQLQAVVALAPGELAVVALDATRPVTAIDAPGMKLITTAALDDGGAGLPGATVDLVPAGALALATAPTLRLTAGTGGAIAADLPSGGRYQLRFADPRRRAAALIVDERPVTAIAPSYPLPRALRIEGTLLRDGKTPLPGASVQVLCMACSGVDRDVPLAEAVSDAAGRFTLAVHDPGTR